MPDTPLKTEPSESGGSGFSVVIGVTKHLHVHHLGAFSKDKAVA